MLMLKRAIKKNYIKKNSCDKHHFNKAAPDYNIALKIVDRTKISHIFQVHPSVKLERGK